MKTVEFVELLSKIESLNDEQLKVLYLQSKYAYNQHNILDVNQIVSQEELELLLQH